MTVRDLLDVKGGFVSIVPPTAQLLDIVEQLEKDDVAAVVVSRDGKTIEGIISTRSIARALKKYGYYVFDRTVCDFMTEDVVTCDILEPISTIYELMHEHQIRHVPVTMDGELCGIVNTLDVVRYYLSKADQ